jgi:hypothetical protein
VLQFHFLEYLALDNRMRKDDWKEGTVNYYKMLHRAFDLSGYLGIS